MQAFFEEMKGLVVFHVSDVLAENRIAVFGKAKGVLKFRAASQDWVHWAGEVHREGRETTRAAHHSREAGHAAYH